MAPVRPLEGEVTESDIQRFVTKTEPSRKYHVVDDGSRSYCLDWTAATNGGYDDQYGVFRWNRRNVYAHRFAYYMEYGQDPGPSTDHLCHNTLCVNVDHLRGGTIADNNLNRRPIISEYCSRGHKRTDENIYVYPNSGKRQCRICYRNYDKKRRKVRYEKEKQTFTHSSEMRDFASDPKLDWDKVREIRRLYAIGDYSQRELAREFKVSQPMVGLIVRGKTWVEDA